MVSEEFFDFLLHLILLDFAVHYVILRRLEEEGCIEVNPEIPSE